MKPVVIRGTVKSHSDYIADHDPSGQSLAAVVYRSVRIALDDGQIIAPTITMSFSLQTMFVELMQTGGPSEIWGLWDEKNNFLYAYAIRTSEGVMYADPGMNAIAKRRVWIWGGMTAFFVSCLLLILSGFLDSGTGILQGVVAFGAVFSFMLIGSIPMTISSLYTAKKTRVPQKDLVMAGAEASGFVILGAR